MKRLLLFVAFVLLAAGASAQTIDRDVLITAEGDVYSIVSEAALSGFDTVLTLTVQSGGKTTHSILPESVDSGVNVRPTLAFDSESNTLYVLWLRMPNAMSSELLVASYQNGKWQHAISLDDKSYVLRYNLSVGITRRIQQVQKDGSQAEVPATILHAVWWEQGREIEGARYAVFGIDKNGVSTPDIHDMTEFITDTPSPIEIANNLDKDLLRHVAVLNGPTPDSVDILFADQNTKSFYRTTLRPISDARVHITVGNRGNGPKIGAPKALSSPWNGRTGTISSPDGDKLILWNVGEKLTYILFNKGKWSASQDVALTDGVTSDAAIAALSRLVSDY